MHALNTPAVLAYRFLVTFFHKEFGVTEVYSHRLLSLDALPLDILLIRFDRATMRFKYQNDLKPELISVSTKLTTNLMRLVLSFDSFPLFNEANENSDFIVIFTSSNIC